MLVTIVIIFVKFEQNPPLQPQLPSRSKQKNIYYVQLASVSGLHQIAKVKVKAETRTGRIDRS